MSPVTPVRFGDASDASEQLPPRVAALADETPATVGEAKPALLRDFVTPPGAPESSSATAAKPRKQSEIFQNKKCAAIKTAASHTTRGKSSVHPGQRNPGNPLVAVGRAVNSFTARIAKDFRRIPLRLSSLIAGH